MNKMFENVKKMKKIEKIEFIIASILTLLLLVSVPVFAWFMDGYKAETMAKIKEPNNLDLRAGNFDPIVNFELRDINIEDMANGTPEYRVFSVSGGNYKINYQIQLAHTTNIPFKYSIWKATETEGPGENLVVYEPINGNETYYYQIEYLNGIFVV